MVKELPSAAKEGEVLTDLQGLMAEAGIRIDAESYGESFSRLSKMSGLARIFLFQINRGTSEPNLEQRERLETALQQLIEERKARGELKEIDRP